MNRKAMKNLATSGVLIRHDCLYKVTVQIKKNKGKYEEIEEDSYYVLAYGSEQAMAIAKMLVKPTDSVVYVGVVLEDQANILVDAISYFDSQASSDLNSLTEGSPAELT